MAVEEAYPVGRLSGHEESINLGMTAKLPPMFDGRVSWFRYEEAVDDWCTITTTERTKWGPLLKSRLTGDALMYRELLENGRLSDPAEGVTYFKKTLRQYFLKGTQNVFLYRFLTFFNHRRHNAEFVTFVSRFEILHRRLQSAWMDTFKIGRAHV